MSKLKLGFMPLTDCAPLVVAKELGFFAQAGLDVSLEKQNSWASMRDKLSVGAIDAGQVLAPMPLAGAMGLDAQCSDLIAPFVLSRNGNAITLSNALFAALKLSGDTSLPLSANQLLPLIDAYKTKGRKLRFATVYPYSCHYLQLLSFLDSGSIKKDDVEIMIISPQNMVLALRSGDIDGFCVGGPYNAKAVRDGVGITVATSIDIWPDLPEKVLAFKKQWYLKHPDIANALIKALQGACRWLEPSANRFEAAILLSQKNYLNNPVDIIAPSLLGSCITKINATPRTIPAYNRFTSSTEQNGNRPNKEEMLKIYRYFNAAFRSPNGTQWIEQLDLAEIYNTAIYDRATDWRVNPTTSSNKSTLNFASNVASSMHQNG